jgi:arylsulfatase
MTYLKNIMGTVKSTLYENFIFIYSLLFITIIPEIIMKINYIGYYQKIGKKIEFVSHSLLCLIFFLGIFTLFALLCSRIKLSWLRRLLYCIFSGVIIISDILGIYITYMYKSNITPAFIIPILETTYSEASEYIATYISVINLVSIIIPILVIYGICYLIKSKITSKHTFFKICTYLACIGWICGIVFIAKNTMSHYAMPVQSIYYSMKDAVQQREELENLERYTNEQNENLTVQHVGKGIPNIVLIVGESENRNHMHLYGYDRDTTPGLDQLAKNHKIAVFTDVVSPHAYTTASLSEIYSLHHYENPDKWYNTLNLIDILKKAGYHTSWLSNQESSGNWVSVANFLANRNDYKEYTYLRDSTSDLYDSYDEKLFPIIDKVKSQNTSDKQFYTIHLMGSHASYDRRVPPNWRKFELEPTNTKADFERNAYDDTVLYNDYVLTQIFKKFDDTDTLIIYISDHGESVYEKDSKLIGHGDGQLNRYMLEIPMIMYGTDTFKENHPELWKKILDAQHRPYMTDDLPHTIMDLLDIRVNGFDASRSIINSEFNSNRNRVIQGQDYNNYYKIMTNDNL